MKELYEFSTIYTININKELLISFYKNIIDSGIVSQKVKDCFNFMDSFETSKIQNIFKSINKY